MSTAGRLWHIEYDSISNDWDKDHDDDRARARLKALGFDPNEIEDHIATLHEDR